MTGIKYTSKIIGNIVYFMLQRFLQFPIILFYDNLDLKWPFEYNIINYNLKSFNFNKN